MFLKYFEWGRKQQRNNVLKNNNTKVFADLAWNTSNTFSSLLGIFRLVKPFYLY